MPTLTENDVDFREHVDHESNTISIIVTVRMAAGVRFYREHMEDAGDADAGAAMIERYKRRLLTLLISNPTRFRLHLGEYVELFSPAALDEEIEAIAKS